MRLDSRLNLQWHADKIDYVACMVFRGLVCGEEPFYELIPQ